MPSRRVPRVVLIVLAVALVGAACSSSGDDARPPVDDPTTSAAAASSTTTTMPSAEPESWTGSVDGFYEAPDPLPPGRPGDLIRVQDLGEQDGLRTVRVMYHSQDATGRDRAVTGIVTHPTTEPPDGGWPVTSQANGTVGLASACALSRNGQPVRDWGVQGVRVATDYVGLGPVGEIHPYLSGPSEGNSVIDVVRAARNLPGSGAGTRWFSVGHSQGGHGALFAGERAAERAPELELMGTVSLAPATELTETYGPLDQVVSQVVGSMMLYGAMGEYPEIRFEDYAGAELLAAADVFETGCLDQIIPVVAAIPGDRLYAHDPLTTDPARSLLQANQPGTVRVPTPLLLAQGTADDRVHVDRTRDFLDRVCALGQVTEYLEVDGAAPGSIVADTAAPAAAWMQARLAGTPPPDTCP